MFLKEEITFQHLNKAVTMLHVMRLKLKTLSFLDGNPTVLATQVKKVRRILKF